MITHLAVVKRQLKAKPTDTSGDQVLYDALRTSEVRFTEVAGFEFFPRIRAYEFYGLYRYELTAENGRLLMLPYPLLSITSIVNGTVTLEADDYHLVYVDDLSGEGPILAIRLIDGSTWVADDSLVGLPSVTITGTWGYSEGSEVDGWRDSGDTVQDNPLTAGATDLTVSDNTAAGNDGNSPWISQFGLIQIESEVLRVEAVPDGTSLTVKRGMLGTTAAEHVQTTPIYVWFAPDDAVYAVARYAASIYARRGSFESSREAPGGGIIRYPNRMPTEVADIALDYQAKYALAGGTV